MIFLSFRFKDEDFVDAVNKCLENHQYVGSYFFPHNQRPEGFEVQIRQALADSTGIVCFVGSGFGKGQANEIGQADKIPGKLFVSTQNSDPTAVKFLEKQYGRIPLPSFNLDHAKHCCAEIIRILKLGNPFDVPERYPFDYEKRIIEEYAAGGGKIGAARVAEGCPPKWPEVERVQHPALNSIPNPVPQSVSGDQRSDTAAIVVDTRTGWLRKPDATDDEVRKFDDEVRKLRFPEAGPRAMLCYPKHDSLTVGILVSGGIAPGINAVIESIVKRHHLYATYDERYPSSYRERYPLRIRGFLEGFDGFLRRPQANSERLDVMKVKRLSGQGGATLRTSRADELLRGDATTRYEHFKTVVTGLQGVDILYVIGGEGSMKAAHALWKISRDLKKPISVVGVPKTMDNDILWVWQSFGFLSAVQEARTALLNLHTEATSNPRLGIVQLFGSDSGFVVSHAALSSGVCDAALIPEVRFSIKGYDKKPDCQGLSAYICQKLSDRLRPECSPSGLIVMAETAIPDDALDFVKDKDDQDDIRLFKEEKEAVWKYFRDGRRVLGQTPDELRSAGLKIVSGALAKDIKRMAELRDNDYWKQFRVFTNEPRHLIRSISPSVSDVVFGERLGALAVDNAMAGYTDFMVSQWLTEYVLVPLKLVTLGRKRVPNNGIFWKSVLASTRQPADMGSYPKEVLEDLTRQLLAFSSFESWLNHC